MAPLLPFFPYCNVFSHSGALVPGGIILSPGSSMSRSMMAKPYCGEKLAQANDASVHRLVVSAHSDRTEWRLPGQAFKGFDDVCCLRPGTSLVDGFFISGFQPGKGLIVRYEG